MIMSGDNKKKATMIISKLKSGGEQMKEAPADETGAEMDPSMPKEAAAEELLAAIESKSAKAVVEALESLMELCD